ncbi:NAD(P)H-binding protein [Rhizohabitans arisaemae]|uniref:NAD(P)H-binding protein n=1 Tax=Rhizohabitans arisaemae TaxID=2720610 RepID=UPI0024B1891E|nr:NAD(P)H-binding protein [Rhizohabitans arisaemae]
MIVITGATGSIGRALVRRLRGEEVTAVVRTPADLGCRYVLGDFERPETIGKVLSPGDRLFLNSSLWPGFVTAHRAVIDLAREAGVAQIVTVSVRDAAPGQPLGGGPHGEVDEYLRASGIPWSILQPVGFMQNLLGGIRDDLIHGSYGPGGVGYIDTRDIADVAAALLTRPVGESRNHILTGTAAPTHDELAAEASAALGRTIRYVDLPIPEMAAHLERHGMSADFAGELARGMARVGDGRWSSTTSEVQDITGHPPRSLADFLADHAAEFERGPK